MFIYFFIIVWHIIFCNNIVCTRMLFFVIETYFKLFVNVLALMNKLSLLFFRHFQNIQESLVTVVNSTMVLYCSFCIYYKYCMLTRDSHWSHPIFPLSVTFFFQKCLLDFILVIFENHLCFFWHTIARLYILVEVSF